MDLNLSGLNDVDFVPVGEAVAVKLSPTIEKIAKQAVTQLSVVLVVGFILIAGAIKSKK